MRDEDTDRGTDMECNREDDINLHVCVKKKSSLTHIHVYAWGCLQYESLFNESNVGVCYTDDLNDTLGIRERVRINE